MVCAETREMRLDGVEDMLFFSSMVVLFLSDFYFVPFDVVRSFRFSKIRMCWGNPFKHLSKLMLVQYRLEGR